MIMKILTSINNAISWIRPNPAFTQKLRKLWLAYAILIGLIVLFFSFVSLGVFGFMPDLKVLENPPINYATEIYSDNGDMLGVFYKEENRINIRYDELSPHLINALICTEDVRFAKHSGIDFKGLARVLAKTILLGNKNAGGGSTVTQQLAKMLFPREKLSNKISFAIRKFREWVIAIRIEKNYTKEEIIALYLNKFDFLNNAVGIKAASKVYFNKSPKKLKIQEAAMLVGMVKGPAIFNPLARPDTTLHRRNVVLSQMVKYNVITEKVFDSLKLLPLGVSQMHIDNNHGIAPYFREYLKNYISAENPDTKKYSSKAQYSEDSTLWVNDPVYGWLNKNHKPDGTLYDLFTDGLKIHTTINSKMQKSAEEAVAIHMAYLQKNLEAQNSGNKNYPYPKNLSGDKLYKEIFNDIKGSRTFRYYKDLYKDYDKMAAKMNEKRNRTIFTYNGEVTKEMTAFDSLKAMKRMLHTGLLSIEPNSGHIKAYVGGINFKYFKFDHINQQRRQVGSTFKPFLYTLAIESGLEPCYELLNSPITIFIDDKPWTPQNHGDDRLGEMVPMKWGLATSNNFIAARLMKKFGPVPLINLAHNLGIKSPLPNVYSLGLGVADLSLDEMVATYGIYATNGVKTEPVFITKIEDKHGNTLAEFKTSSNEVLSGTTAYIVNKMMQGVAEAGGTGARLRWKYKFTGEIAGKTGTTNDNTDGWFIGITPKLVTGVWVGGENRDVRFSSTAWGAGSSSALPIWAEYMKRVYEIDEVDYSENDTFTAPVEFDESYFNCTEQDKDMLR